jgi:hypothetical protein
MEKIGKVCPFFGWRAKDVLENSVSVARNLSFGLL